MNTINMTKDVKRRLDVCYYGFYVTSIDHGLKVVILMLS